MKNKLLTIAWYALVSAMAVGTAVLIDPIWAWIAVFSFALYGLSAYFLAQPLLLALNEARELPVEQARGVHRMVEELARRARIAKPRLFVMADHRPNAFTVGRGPGHSTIVLTRGILWASSARELRGVLAHEIAYIESHEVFRGSMGAMIAATLMSPVRLLATGIRWRKVSSAADTGVIAQSVSAALAPMAALVVRVTAPGKRQLRADRTAARWTGDPDGLADALEILALSEPTCSTGDMAVASLFLVAPRAANEPLGARFSTHPPIARRVAQLRALKQQMNDIRSSRVLYFARGV